MATVSANGLSVVHKGSNGKAMCDIPDICNIPGPNGAIPVPFSNKAESKDLIGGTVSVQIEGESVAVMGSMISKSSGDASGVLGGIISGSTQGKALFISWSPDVIMEMRPVCRKTDKLIMNDINTICLSGWDQDDVEAAEGREWIQFNTIDFDTQKPVGNVKLKITLPDGSEQETESNPAGVITIVDLDPGSCSVELNEKDEDTPIIKIEDNTSTTGLATRNNHIIHVIVDNSGDVSA